MKKIEEYKNETHRNRRKINRRRDALNELAQTAGWANWSEYETAVKNGVVQITGKATIPADKS